MKRSFSIELIIITILGFIYFAFHAPTIPTSEYSPPTLDLRPVASLFLDTSVRPMGLEHERLAGAILPIRVGLEHYGHIPTWNSLLSNGIPLTNDAFSYALNPFHSLPVLILGGVTGSKIAILIALLIAGYSMWILGLALGLGAVARVAIGLFYLMNGSIAAKFGAGHFQLACSLAWPPLVLATLCWTLQSSKRIAPIAFGISFALLYYAGNIYYTLHIGLCCMVIVALHLITRDQNRWRFRRDRLQRAILAAIFAFGLAALQFFPNWLTRDYISHSNQYINSDGSISNNYDLHQTIDNLVVPWQQWTNYQPTILFDAVDYAYIGSTVFALIVLALVAKILQLLLLKSRLAKPKNHLRIIVASLLIAIFMMIWAGGQAQPFPWLYANVPMMAQFRFLGRVLAIADLFWIVLAGIALDTLWDMLRLYAPLRTRKRLLWLCAIAACGWIFMVIYSASEGGDRILMVARYIPLWEILDVIRYTSMTDALRGFIHIMIGAALLDIVVSMLQRVVPVIRRKSTLALSSGIAYTLQLGLLAIIAFSVLDLMVSSKGALQFTTGSLAFDTIYEDIRQVDQTNPFPIVILPFSPFTFDAYENEIRLWSLNEGWVPAAVKDHTLTMNRLFNYPRWIIAEHDKDGNLRDLNIQDLILSQGYERRACYVTDTSLILSNCSVRRAGFNLYEWTQALPYAFIVSDPVITNNPSTLTADQVNRADVLLYQQDNMVIHATDNLSDFNKHYLVVQEANFPGWQVTIDGVPTQTVTVPTYFIGEQTLGIIGIPTQKGDHTYALTFNPPGATIGLAIFLATLILIVVYLTYRRKQKSPA